MVARNPAGYPLSAETLELEDGDFVIYRPRIKGRKRRPRVKLPEILARAFESAAGDEVKERQALRHAGEPDAWRAPARRKKAAKKASKKRTKKKAAKRSSRRAPAAVEVREEETGQRRLFNPGRSPVDLGDLGTPAALGDVHELIVDDGRQLLQHKWTSGRPLLCWSPRQKALIFVPGRAHKVAADADRRDGAARLFERWSARDAVETRQAQIPAVTLRLEGRAVSIVYSSDKWVHNKKRVYEHDFGAGVGAFKGGNVFAVTGGRLTVTERGIVH